MTQVELTVYCVVLVLAFVLVMVKAHFWLCASRPMKGPPAIPEGANTLKTWPGFFRDIFDGHKTFEVRKHDREFGLDQVWYLRKWIPPSNPTYTVTDKEYHLPGRYTGSWVKVKITYLMEHQPDGPCAGVSPGYCVWGFKVLEKWDDKLGLHLNERGLII